MKNILVLIISGLTAIMIAVTGIAAYRLYDTTYNGFIEDEYIICEDQTLSMQTFYDGDLKWSIDDRDIAKINQKGEITGLKKGSAIVTASHGLTKYEVSVSVVSHSLIAADCVNPPTCSICGATEGEPLGHKVTEYSCDKDTICSRCNQVAAKALGHEYSPLTCVDDSTCIRCGKIKARATGHSFEGGNCQTVATCAICGAKGELGNHKYSESISCTEAGVCVLCGAGSESAVGHDFSKATCTEDSVCTRCGEPGEKALGHNFVESETPGTSICTRCNEKLIVSVEDEKDKDSTDKTTDDKTTDDKTSDDKKTDDKKDPAASDLVTDSNNDHVHDNKVFEGEDSICHEKFTATICLTCNRLEYVYAGLTLNTETLSAKFNALKAEFPEGTAYTAETSAGWEAGNNSWGNGVADTGTGADAFAYAISDKVFIRLPARKLTAADFDNNPASLADSLKVGDIIRMDNDTKTVTVINKLADGTLVFVEANPNVHWGRTAKPADIASSINYVISRYPKE